MGLTAPLEQLRSLQRGMESLQRPDGAAQRTILRGIKQQVSVLLRSQFQTSTGPSGAALQPTKRGAPALVSKKLPQAFEFQIEDGAIRGVGKTKRDLLTALHAGHVFAARHVGAQKQFLTFSRGKLVKAGRALNKQGQVRRGIHQTFSQAHTVSERRLPPRPIIPEGNALPPPWDAAVRAGVAVGMQWWVERLSR